jgi:hypothetical protein
MEPNPEEKREEDPNLHEAREHARAAREEMRKTFEALLPPTVVEHRRAAKREWLLAMRSMVNAAIDRMDRVERREPADPTGPSI